MTKNIFPKGFFFGAATSSHQVEGGCFNDWSEWEKKNAYRLSHIANRYYNTNNYISGRACDHYHKFKEDFNLERDLINLVKNTNLFTNYNSLNKDSINPFFTIDYKTDLDLIYGIYNTKYNNKKYLLVKKKAKSRKIKERN